VKIDDVPRRDPQVVDQTVDGEKVLVHPSQGVVRVLNVTGAFLWDRIDGHRSVADLASEMAERYEVSPGQARIDALTFFEDLAQRGVIGLSEPA
jgi:hypothetical protein